jgi:hypothetical protein
MLDGSLRGAVRTPIDPRRTPARRPTKDIKSRPSVPSAKKGPTLWPPAIFFKLKLGSRKRLPFRG